MYFIKNIKVGKSEISSSSRVFIIAEAGVNHNGSIKTAMELIDVAAEAGADAVKFQTYNAKDIILSSVEKAKYQKQTTNPSEKQIKMLEKLQIDKDFHIALIDHCKKKEIIFISTPYDEKSLALLIELQVPLVKIASTDTTNLLFLEKVAKTGLPVMLSTGMSYLSEIEKAYSCLKENGCSELAILRCTSNYPTTVDEVNLLSLITLKNAFPDVTIGFSDHTEGVGASPYAVALGARIIEKHFTLDKNMNGPDHKASLNPTELNLWVEEIRKVEKMLGNGVILPTKSEANTKTSLQKWLVSKTVIPKGSEITRENITAKRTGGVGIKADFAFEILGKRVNKVLNADEIINWNDLE